MPCKFEDQKIEFLICNSSVHSIKLRNTPYGAIVLNGYTAFEFPYHELVCWNESNCAPKTEDWWFDAKDSSGNIIDSYPFKLECLPQ
ncbi:MAG: hypothetical protein CMJ94_09480 [Planctomycetes bacterium]|nr:hypothetical protein [Planctomycetota bacterium]